MTQRKGPQAAPIAFGPLSRGVFLERPNRFIVHARLRDGRQVRAVLPNPGRLRELLLPGAPLWLEEATAEQAARRKTQFTVVAVERDGAPVLLHTHATNSVAKWMLEEGLAPGLEDARILRAEATVGRSRFDFKLERDGRPLLLEVKSVTLFGRGVAMFPDAVTARGRRHVEELAELSGQGVETAVLFVIHTDTAQWFMPDYHTDLAFSQTLMATRDAVTFIPVAIGWDEDLTIHSGPRRIEIPWDHLEREVDDRGAYLIVAHLPRAERVTVGGLGERRFEAGHYIYVGSAMRHLSRRVARHLRRRKKMRWHIDYLRAAASDVTALPIRSSAREECALAAALSECADAVVKGFGSSDCRCGTHLFFSKESPLDHRDFHDLLERFRMRAPDGPSGRDPSVF